MPLRLIAEIAGRRWVGHLSAGENLVGTGADCALRVPDPTISRHHALVQLIDEMVTLEDLGSTNGTLIDGRRISGTHPWRVGESVKIGNVKVTLEQVGDTDLEPAILFETSAEDRVVVEETGTLAPATASLGSFRVFSLELLPGLVRKLQRGDNLPDMCQAAGAALARLLPMASVRISLSSTTDPAIQFSSATLASGLDVETVEARVGEVAVAATLPDRQHAEIYRPLIETLAGLIALAAEGPIDPAGESSEAPPVPEPPTLEPEVRRIYSEAARVARGDISVLIVGESGTGKEVLARFIHTASPRADRPLVALNCAALPQDLLEAELFGIERGVATGVDARPGKFELADGGTLFLDEIGDMALATQAKILRVLQEGAVFRLGGSEARSARARVLSATNRDPAQLLAEGKLRQDLYHRITDWKVELPPLRQRKADIPNLAAHFLAREGSRRGVRLRGLSRAALDRLVAHDWPGNIRQLEREMARVALFLDDRQLLESGHLQDSIGAGSEAVRSTQPLKDALEDLERREIERALTECANDTRAAARLLGISRSTLYRRIRQLGLRR